MHRLSLAVALLTALALPTAAQGSQQWNPLFSPGANGEIFGTTVADDGTLYLGGTFTQINGQFAVRVAAWNPITRTSSALGFGITGSGTVAAMDVADDGSVFVGGTFNTAGGQTARRIARWDPSANGGNGAWNSLGDFNSSVSAIVAAPDGGVYVGGGFTQVTRNSTIMSCPRVCRWDPAANGGNGDWEPTDRGLNGSVSDLHVGADGTLYAVGPFTGYFINPTQTAPALHVAQFDPTANGGIGAWSALDGGVQGILYAVTEGADGRIYVGGDFSQTGASQAASNIAVWDEATLGDGWGPVAGGTNGRVWALETAPDGSIVVAGDFTEVGGTSPARTARRSAAITTNQVARWDPNVPTWSALPGLGTSGSVRTLSVAPTGAIYAAGFEILPGVDMARWDPSAAQTGVADLAGWRLLAPPGAGITVHDLAGLNLVQGVPAGTPSSTFPQQYPGADPNVFTGYGGDDTGDYVAAASTDEALQPGRGFFWYFFDQAFGPFANGTSASVDLAGFVLDRDATATPGTRTVTVTDNTDFGDDDYHLLGNPFDAPFAVDGISTAGGVLAGGAVQAYQPGSGYQILLASNPGNAGEPDVADVWQGFFGELIPSTPGGSIDVTYELDAVEGAASPAFYGRTAPTPYVHIRLSGETTSDGTPFADQAALVRFFAEATPTWDVHDMSRLEPPGGPYSLLAPVVQRDGGPYRLSLDSRPLGEGAEIPVAFTATEASTVTLEWEGVDTLPSDWTATLADRQTGDVVDLKAQATYTFDASSSEWTERFVLSLTSPSFVDAEDTLEAEVSLTSPSPNPATRQARMTLRSASGRTEVALFDALGRRVATVLDRELATGSTVPLAVDVSGLATGVYVLRATTGDTVLTRSLTVVR